MTIRSIQLLTAVLGLAAAVLGVVQYTRSSSSSVNVGGNGIAAAGDVKVGGSFVVGGDAYQTRIRDAALAYTALAISKCDGTLSEVEALTLESKLDPYLVPPEVFPDQAAAEFLGAGVVDDVKNHYSEIQVDLSGLSSALGMNAVRETMKAYGSSMKLPVDQKAQAEFPGRKEALRGHVQELCDYFHQLDGKHRR